MTRRLLAFVPAYNCERQIGRALAQFDDSIAPYVSELIVVENRSQDGTVQAAVNGLRKLKRCPSRLLQNDENYGLGGSHKVAFNYAIDNGFHDCLVFHGDDQGRLRDVLPHLLEHQRKPVDCLLGARFMPRSRLVGYSRLRTWGNRAFNLFYSAVARQWLYDLGSGLNLYAVSALSDRFYLKLPDDLTFNYGLILASCARNMDMRFFPIEWREEDQLSNVRLFRQAAKAIRIAASYRLRPAAFLSTDQSGAPGRTYSWTSLCDTPALAG
jgi:dolichol-phosphate mannosyltransferase